jgi:hypothetical protein
MAAVDAQLGDEDAEECLGLLGLAFCDDLFESAGHRGEVGFSGRGCVLCGGVGKLVLLGAEVVEAGGQLGEALLAALGGEAALLERLKVARGCVFAAGDLGGDGMASLIERRLLPLRIHASGGEGVVDQ